MPVLFSRACEYAIHGLVEMARYPEEEFWRIQDLAQKINVPSSVLAKTFQTLVKEQILYSAKGPGGGFSFALPTKKISLMKIVNIIDGSNLFQNCILGHLECNGNHLCPIHELWESARDIILNNLNQTTFDKFAG